jgi:hypothetical protein
MKRLFIFLSALFFTFCLGASEVEWQDQFVYAYRDADPALFGHSYNRNDPIKLDIFLFDKSRTMPVENGGYLTAVTLQRRVKESLDALLAANPYIIIDGRSLRLVSRGGSEQSEEPLYVYREHERGIFIGFTLEKAPQQLLDFINLFYRNEPSIAEVVTNYYKENYVIRIVQAENVYSGNDVPTLEDILFNATLLGDNFQQLLGMHDGLNYLSALEAFYRERTGYSILTDNFDDALKPSVY